MIKKVAALLCIAIVFLACNKDKPTQISSFLEDVPEHISQKKTLDTPYLTAGNTIFMIGAQNGSFSNLKGSNKKGIWNQHLKLMDGFEIKLDFDDKSYALDKAQSFTSYPFASEQQYTIKEKKISIKRFQFVPDNEEGLVVQLEIYNNGTTSQEFDLSFTGHSDLNLNQQKEAIPLVNGQDQANYIEALKGWIVKDSKNPWFLCYAASEEPKQNFTTRSNTTNLTVSNTLNYNIKISKGQSKLLSFTIASSFTSEKDAITNLNQIQTNLSKLLSAKKERYKKLATKTKLSTSNQKINRTFEWLQYHTDWLENKVIAPKIKSIAAIFSDHLIKNTLDTITKPNYNPSNTTLNHLEQLADSFNYAFPIRLQKDLSNYDIETHKANSYNFIDTIQHTFFGIRANTAEKTITIQPKMPDKWQNAALENIAIGPNTVSIYFSQNERNLAIRTIQTNWDWSFEVILPKKQKNDGLVIKLGNEIAAENNTFKISAVNGEIDAAVYFQKNKSNTD